MNSVFGKCIEATRGEIVALGLPGIRSDRIVSLSVPRPTDQAMKVLPAIAIAPFGAETVTTSTNLSDDIGYPVVVILVDATENKPEASADLDRRLGWRQSIIDRLFRNRSLDIDGLLDVLIEPQPAIDPGWWGQGLYVSAFVVRFIVRQRRRVA